MNSLSNAWNLFIKHWRWLPLTIFIDIIFIIGFLAIQLLTLIKNQESIQKLIIMLSKNFENFNLLDPSMEVLQTTAFAENYSLLLSWFAVNIASVLLLFIICKGINWTIIAGKLNTENRKPITYFFCFALITIFSAILFALILKALFFLGAIVSLFISLLITYFFAVRAWSLASLKNFFRFTKDWLIACFASFFAVMFTFGGFLVNSLLGAITVLILLPLVEQFSRVWLISTANIRENRKFYKKTKRIQKKYRNKG